MSIPCISITGLPEFANNAIHSKTNKVDPNANNAYLSLFLSKHGSNGKNMSSLSIPPKAFECSDSSESLKINSSDVENKLAASACWQNSSTIEGRHTCQKCNRIKTLYIPSFIRHYTFLFLIR